MPNHFCSNCGCQLEEVDGKFVCAVCGETEEV